MTETAASPDGTLERTPDGGVIHFERHLPYPIEAVWDAITNPARLADWWLPFDADITIDLREGGELVFAATSGEPPPLTCTILRVEPPVLFEHTAFVEGATLRWELEAVPEGTVLRLHEHVASVDEAIEGGWLVGLHTLVLPPRAGDRRLAGAVGLGRARRRLGPLRRAGPRHPRRGARGR